MCYWSYSYNQVINPLSATDIFLYPLKISENLCFSGGFGVYKETSGMKWFNLFIVPFLLQIYI